MGKSDRHTIHYISYLIYTVVNLCIGEGKDKCNLDVPFLITADKISNPNLGFSAIKRIVQTTDDKLLMKLFRPHLTRLM